MNDQIKLFNAEPYLSTCCYGIDVSKAENMDLIIDLVSGSNDEWTEEGLDRFLFTSFRDLQDVLNYFSNVDEIEDYISCWLTNNKDLNPKQIGLTFVDQKVLFVPKDPWEYSENEKELDKASLFELLENVAEFFGIREEEIAE